MLGMKFLRGDTSQDVGFIEGLYMKRVARVVDLMHFLPPLRDPQSELLLH